MSLICYKNSSVFIVVFVLHFNISSHQSHSQSCEKDNGDDHDNVKVTHAYWGLSILIISLSIAVIRFTT